MKILSRVVGGKFRKRFGVKSGVIVGGASYRGASGRKVGPTSHMIV